MEIMGISEPSFRLPSVLLTMMTSPILTRTSYAIPADEDEDM